MSRAKLLFAACFAVFVISAMAVASASAAEPGWMVGGSNITTAQEILSSVLVLQHGELEVKAGENVVIKCEGNGTINTGKITPPHGVEATSVTFEECAVTSGNCTVTKTISTVPVHGEVTLDGALNTSILVLPKTKNTFATIKFEGGTCAISGTQPVTGHVHILIHEGFDERTLHLVLAFSLVGAFKVGANEAVLRGLDADVRLASGQPWSFL